MRKNWLALACGVAVMPAMVHAQEAEQESAQERAWDIETEASYLLSRGNSESESISARSTPPMTASTGARPPRRKPSTP